MSMSSGLYYGRLTAGLIWRRFYWTMLEMSLSIISYYWH